jgi:effector-binding domain-containing protein
MSHECELTYQDAQPALAVRVRTSVQGLAQVLGQAYGDVSRYLAKAGGRRAGAPFVAYHSMDIDDLDLEIGFPVVKRMQGDDVVRATEIPAGEYASCVHEGPYSGLPSVHEAVRQWIEVEGFEAAGVAYEVYLTDPSLTLSEELRTQVAYLLKC